MADRTGMILKALGLFSPLRGARRSRTSKLLSQFAEPLGSRTFGIFLESGDKFEYLTNGEPDGNDSKSLGAFLTPSGRSAQPNVQIAFAICRTLGFSDIWNFFGER